MRKAFQNLPKKFDSFEAAVSDLAGRISTPKAEWVQQAKLLSDYRFQTTLDFFFKK